MDHAQALTLFPTRKQLTTEISVEINKTEAYGLPDCVYIKKHRTLPLVIASECLHRNPAADALTSADDLVHALVADHACTMPSKPVEHSSNASNRRVESLRVILFGFLLYYEYVDIENDACE
ncbi:hypothetical protein KFK09_018854 [Dendrobium nobile]|uniref:Uncharacterized protein n=1 Tax=Dendrobium nobile TaxID=94219 RepID=A0A8T3AXB5_DENNO|nr:hypothetical protein KFK09_018854 [Dendrobium nobile]